MALRQSAQELGLTVAPQEPYGVLMETGYPQASVTLVALGEGTASLYFSTGGGVIGGGGHLAVRAAAKSLVALAQQHLGTMERTIVFPLPNIGDVCFYVLTPVGVLTCRAREEDLGTKKNDLWPLFYGGQKVITELRLISQAQGNG